MDSQELKEQQPPLRRLSVNAFAPSEIDLIMRTNPKQFTEEEIAALAAFDLPDPDDETLRRFVASGAAPAAESPAPVQADGAGTSTESAHLADYLREGAEPKTTHASRPTTAQQRARGARLAESALPLPTSSASELPSSNALARAVDGGDEDTKNGPVSAGRRLSQQLHHKPAHVSPSIDDTKRIFDILSRQDLVGGPETVAEAILNTRHVDLADRAVTTTVSAECFLNATHVYLQNNRLTDLDGLLLLAQLRVLVVHHNRLTSLTPLAVLDALMYLDASDNEVERLDAPWDLPCASLQYLNLIGNPCCPVPRDAITDGTPRESTRALPAVKAYRAAIESACPALEVLDELLTNVGEAAEEEEGEEEVEVEEEAPVEKGETGVISERAPESAQRAEENTTTTPTPPAKATATPPTKRASKSQPTKPSTAPSRGAHRPAPRQSSSPPRRASDGTKTSRTQQRLHQVRADAVQVGAGRTGKAHTAARHTSTSPQPTADAQSGRRPSDPATPTAPCEDEGEEGPSEALKTALRVKRKSLTSGPIMSADEERLLQQFQTWAQTRREAVLATLDQPNDDDDPESDGGAASLADVPAMVRSGDAAYMQGKMYLDVEFADKVARDRLERSLGDTWAGVAKVRQTRMAVLAERRRQQRDALKDHSKMYQDTLQLLKKEGFTEDLEPYRTRASAAAVAGEGATSQQPSDKNAK